MTRRTRKRFTRTPVTAALHKAATRLHEQDQLEAVPVVPLKGMLIPITAVTNDVLLAAVHEAEEVMLRARSYDVGYLLPLGISKAATTFNGTYSLLVREAVERRLIQR